MVDMHFSFMQPPQVLYLAVSLVDRYLEKQVIQGCDLPLVGATCFNLAAKYEGEDIHEVWKVWPRYSQCDFTEMEKSILNRLDFRLSVPTVYHFLAIYLDTANEDRTTRGHANYVLNCMIYLYDLLRYLPSELAACAVFLARKASGSPWRPILEKQTNYTEDHMRYIALTFLREKKRRNCKCYAVVDKYCSSISNIPWPSPQQLGVYGYGL
jgi:hypothetical protein